MIAKEKSQLQVSISTSLDLFYEALRVKTEDLEKRENLLLEREKRMEAYHQKLLLSNARAKLNIGGRKFETFVSNFSKEPSSMLATMFSGRWNLPMDTDGYVFIDRDGTYFEYILNYLRDLTLPPSLTDKEREHLMVEANFYGLNGMFQLLGGGPLIINTTVSFDTTKQVVNASVFTSTTITSTEGPSIFPLKPLARGTYRFILTFSGNSSWCIGMIPFNHDCATLTQEQPITEYSLGTAFGSPKVNLKPKYQKVHARLDTIKRELVIGLDSPRGHIITYPDQYVFFCCIYAGGTCVLETDQQVPEN